MTTDKPPEPLRVPEPAILGAVQALCESRDPYAAGTAADALFVSAMRQATEWHMQRSPFYRELARQCGFTSNSLYAVDDCASIPFVPATFFKLHEAISIPPEQVHLRLTSSGTTGQKSQMFFDRWSIEAPQRMVDWIYEFYGWTTPHLPTNYLLFTYQTLGEGNLGTAYTDHYLCKFAPGKETFTALRLTGDGGHEFDGFGTIEALQRFAASGLPVRIFGFPSFLYFTLERMRKLGVPKLVLSPQSLVFLGGGWKGHANQEIEKLALYQMVADYLGIPDERIRDGFGSVEHCIPYVECVRHNFHVPIWSRVIIRDLKTLAPLGLGQRGMLSFVSPYITSVPAISVVMGDLATLRAPEDCGCGLNVPWFVVHGRAGTSKNRSCAIAASELLTRGT